MFHCSGSINWSDNDSGVYVKTLACDGLTEETVFYLFTNYQAIWLSVVGVGNVAKEIISPSISFQSRSTI